MQIKLPKEYENYLKLNGIFEGFTTGKPGYIRLWPFDELPAINSEIEIQERAPGYLAFASDGGNEVIAFNPSGAVFMLPLIGMEAQYAVGIADSFTDLASRFEHSG